MVILCYSVKPFILILTFLHVSANALAHHCYRKETGNSKIGMINYGHFQRLRAQKDSGSDVLLLFFITLVDFVVAGLFLFSIWSAFLHYSGFQACSSITERKRDQGKSRKGNVVTANGFIGMIPVINFSAPS